MFFLNNYKDKFLTISILKNKFNKDNFRKNHVEKHCNEAKTMWRNTVAINNVSKKKTIKLNSQPI
jgi:hypothetical protein